MDIVIIGGGGHGRVVLDIVRNAGLHRPVAVIDSNAALAGRRVDGVPIVGGPEMLPELRTRGVSGAIVAIGDNGARRSLAEEVVELGFDRIQAIHPSAQISTTARIGETVVISAGALICAHCQIGDSTILNTGCIVDHESMIGTAAHICPGVRLAGHVTVESGAFVGIGATVIQNIRIGFDAIVGAGAVVVSDVGPMTTVVGVPAREIKDAPDAAQFAALLHPKHARLTVRHGRPVQSDLGAGAG
ncbi:MAG: acetyltransferase [Phycisphaerae bacterium]